MLVINFFGGPGCGKSTTAAKLFYKMKEKGLKVEYISEYAKDLVYAKDTFRLEDQIKILGEQHHKQWILKDQVDFCIVDGPFLLGSIYAPEEYFENFSPLVVEMFKSYKNYNIFLERTDIEYQDYGRSQDLDGAKIIDEKIIQSLKSNKIDYMKMETLEFSRHMDNFLRFLSNY
jgi:nicotinamide riboside kinase